MQVPTLLLTLLAATTTTLAAPAPGPGPAIPTIPTSDIDPVPDLPALPLDKRWTLSCQDNGGGYRPVGEAQACVNFLLHKGDAPCRVENANSVFCRSGDTVITGSNIYARPGGVSSTCRDVALGAQRVIDSCTTPQGFVAGNDAANGNGDLIIAINRV
ncbi:hypothetical protein BJX62DRAFT_234270 [Aspergillus germanicus]